MKFLAKYILIIGIFFVWSCDPLEDDLELAIEEAGVGVISEDFSYTLVEDDYTLIGKSFGSLSNEDEVRDSIPVILNANFPALGARSSAIVSYQFFNGSSPDLRGDYTEITVPKEDYDLFDGRGEEDVEGEETDDHFWNQDEDVIEWVNWKEITGADGDYIDVTFDYKQGDIIITGVVTRLVYTVVYGWQYTMILDDALYGDFFDESGIDFSDSDEGEEKVPTYLNYLTSMASDYSSINMEEGSTIVVQYNFDDRCFDDCDGDFGEPNVPDVALYIFRSGVWIPYSEEQTTTESLSFGHDGVTWVPDNTIKYTFSSADFAVAGDEANGLGNAAARDNLRQYGNFGTQWSEEEIFGAINFVLKLNFPDNEVGQKYLVTYSTFPAGNLEVNLILDESGDYIEITE